MPNKKIGYDRHPQFLRGRVAESAPNTLTEVELATPNLTEAGFVMEILKIFWDLDLSVMDGASADGLKFAIYETSRTALPFYSDSGTIFIHHTFQQLTSSGTNIYYKSGMMDYTDGAGNGLLIGRKKIILAITGISQTAGKTVNFAILYRLVKISPAELVGLISS